MTKPKTFWIASIVVIILGLVIFFITTQTIKPNYAEEVARPIEQALIRAGAKKNHGSGDGGYGSDNSNPGYTSLFSIPLNEGQATGLINRVAADNGFNLKEATKADKGPINIDDAYLCGIYYDFTSRDADNPDLQDGAIEFWIDINKENTDTDPKITTVQLDFDLPSFK